MQDQIREIDSQTIALFIAVLSSILFTINELIRLLFPKYNQKFCHFFSSVMKKQEREGLLALLPYIWGTSLLLTFWHKPIVVFSLINLVFGDLSASLIGEPYSKSKRGKSALGTVAFITSSSLIAMAYLTFDPTLYERYQYPIVLGSGLAVITSAVAEHYSFSISRGWVDDNLAIPLISALTISGVLLLFGYSQAEIFNSHILAY